MEPIEQLKRQIEHYERSGVAFREDADRYHKKAIEAFRIADEYKAAIAKLETN